MKHALITGITGQDGVYLARLLLAQGYRVTGIASSLRLTPRNVAYLAGVELVSLDLRDTSAVSELVTGVEPDEIYNLAALSSVGQSWKHPALTWQVNATAVEALVAAAVQLRARSGREVRLFQASSAEVRGAAADSPYARSKAAAEEIVREARATHGFRASCGILFNHESPLRAPEFVTRKITLGVAEIAMGRRRTLTLGNLDVRRDWGFAGDYVEAMRLLVAADEPLDLEIGTGFVHSLADLVEVAFKAAGVGDPEGRIVTDPGLLRPSDAPVTVANPRPAERVLGWRARVSFAETIRHMVNVDIARLWSSTDVSDGYLMPQAMC